MGDFLEGIVVLLPVDAGGRLEPIAPREGSYRPHVGSMRARFIEGPPTIEPGEAGLVVIELENATEDELPRGAELQVLEDDRVVGFVTVTRVWRSAVAV